MTKLTQLVYFLLSVLFYSYGAFSFGKHGFCYTKTRPAGRLA